MRNVSLTLLIGALVTASFGCAKKENHVADTTAIKQLNEGVDLGTVALAELMDDQAGSASAGDSRSAIESIEYCQGRAITAACQATGDGGLKEAAYSSCRIWPNLTLTGSVKLHFSQSDCRLDSNGASVNQRVDLILKGPLGGTLEMSSAVHEDYRQTSVGGGTTLKLTGPGSFDLDVAGVHVVRRGIVFRRYDVSVRTLSPLKISGGLAREGRVIDGGQFEINHNIAKYTATYTPENLKYSASCSHPVSGKLVGTLKGSLTGDIEVSFNGCGNVSVDWSGSTSADTLPAPE